MFKGQTMIGVMYALIATIFWGGSFIIARLAVGEISPLTLGFCRWAVTLAILLCFALPRLKREWPIAKTFLVQIIAASALGVAAYSPLVYVGAQTTSAVNLALIGVTSPMFIVIISACMGTKQSLNTWIGCFLALVGSVYLVCNGNLEQLLGIQFALGDILMLIAAMGFAIYSIILKKIPEGLSSITVMTLLTLFAVLMLVPCVIWEVNQPNMVFNINGTVIFSIVFAALCASLTAWLTWNIALTKAGPELCGMIYYTMPLWGGLFALVFLGEPITSTHIVSGVLIIGGILWSSRK